MESGLIRFADVEIDPRIREVRLDVRDGRAVDARSILDEIGPDTPPAVRIGILEILAAATSDRTRARRHWQEAIDLANAHSERGRAGRLLVAMTRREMEMGHIEQARANVRLLQADYGNWPGVDDLQQRVEGIETGEAGSARRSSVPDDLAGKAQIETAKQRPRKPAICRRTRNQAESASGKQTGSPHNSLTGAESRRAIWQECSISHATVCVAYL